MAESSRKVRKTKDGRKIVTRTKANGTTVKKVLGKKGEDGKRTASSTTRTRTTASGATVKKRTNKKGSTVKTRTGANGRTKSTKTNAAGKVVRKTSTNKAGNETTISKRGSSAVRAANKVKNATTESKGRAGRINRLQERMSDRKAAGKGTTGLRKKIRKAKKGLTSAIDKRRAKK